MSKLQQQFLSRLPRYYRYCRELLGADVGRISSAELASMMELSAPLVRSDLGIIGHCGQQGYGYSTRDIYEASGELIGLNSGKSFIIAGMDSLGRAFAEHRIFTNRGIRLSGLFDYGDNVGQKINTLTVRHMMYLSDFCRDNSVDIAVICVPPEQAEEVCSLALNGGVRGICNFSGAELRKSRAYPDAVINNVNLSDILLSLCCSLNNSCQDDSKE